jgi:hypothetical protein
MGTAGMGGTKQRALLADLIVNVGAIVPTAKLIDDLWGDDPPPSADHTVETCISRIRRILRVDRSADCLLTRPPGYVLDVGAERSGAGVPHQRPPVPGAIPRAGHACRAESGRARAGSTSIQSWVSSTCGSIGTLLPADWLAFLRVLVVRRLSGVWFVIPGLVEPGGSVLPGAACSAGSTRFATRPAWTRTT